MNHCDRYYNMKSYILYDNISNLSTYALNLMDKAYAYSRYKQISFLKTNNNVHKIYEKISN